MRNSSLQLNFAYRAEVGVTQTELLLQTCSERPRPAWCQINDLKVDREVWLPDYQQILAAKGQRIALDDPMELMAAAFLSALRNGRGVEESGDQCQDVRRYGDPLRRAHADLLQWDEACRLAVG